jgi:hypothetical protein
MDIIVTLVDPGISVGPFNIYSNADSFVAPVATGISRASLLAGYTLTGVSNLTTTVKLVSTGTCDSIIFLPVVGITSTTTSTSTSTSTTTSTTSSTSTSTSTTTSTTTSSTNYRYDFTVTPSGDVQSVNLLNISPIVIFTTSYTLNLVGRSSYDLAGNSIVALPNKIIQKIERLAYDGVTVLQTITVNSPNFLFATGQMIMTSTGTAGGSYQTIKITIV